MSPEEFRRQGHAVIDWIADYWSRLDDLPGALAQVAPGEVRRPAPRRRPGATAEPFEALLADLRPGGAARDHPLAAPTLLRLLPGQLLARRDPGRPLSSGIGAQGMLWATSPAVTEVEQVVLDWLRPGPRPARGVRRERPGRRRHPGHRVHRDLHRAAGRPAPRHRGPARGGRRGGRTCGSTAPRQAHSSLLKAAMMSGLGEQARPARSPSTPHPGHGRRRAPRGDGGRRGGGLRPVMVQAAAGTTSTGAIDDVAAIARGGARARRLAARGRRLGRRGGGVPRAPRRPRRRRARRLLRDQPAQVAAHHLRLQRLLGARPGRPARRAVAPPGVPAQPRLRVRRGRRLPRLASPARTAVPRRSSSGPCCAPTGWRGCGSTSATGRRPGRRFAGPGPRRRPVRAGHRAGARAGGVPRWSAGDERDAWR